MTHDAIIIGGSYAGMAAALQLGRARRDVLVIDAGQPRNRFASQSHGFLGQDGAAPGAIAEQARKQLMAYPTISWTTGTATRAETDGETFTIDTQDGARHSSKRLVLAHGINDTLPDIPGMQERWGRHVFHCPYCHGYELGQGEIGVIATGEISMHQALLLPDWGSVTFFVNGAFEPDAEQRAELAARGIAVEETPIREIAGGADVVLEDGRVLSMAGLFTATRTTLNSPLAHDLGCAMVEGPLGAFIKTDDLKATSVPGVFACGDAARGAHSVALAVGDGTFAGGMTHRSLVFP